MATKKKKNTSAPASAKKAKKAPAKTKAPPKTKANAKANAKAKSKPKPKPKPKPKLQLKPKAHALAAPAAKPKKIRYEASEVFANSPVIERGEGGQIRVLIGKAGLDGHDRGAKVIARACRDAGFEVVYTGLHQTPEMIVNTAIQEDVDVVGLSILSGAHTYLVPEIVKGLSGQGVKVGKDMLILVGGIIPDSDFEVLRKAGVSMVFTPGTSVDSIISYIRTHVKPKA